MTPLWTEACTFQKHTKGKLRDTVRVFINVMHWCKTHSDKTGKEQYFNSVEELQTRLDALHNIRFRLATSAVPTHIVSRFAYSLSYDYLML